MMSMTKNIKIHKRNMGKKLCENCKTGQELLSLDEHTFACPYIRCNTGKKCYFYKPINDSHPGICCGIKKFLKKIFNH